MTELTRVVEQVETIEWPLFLGRQIFQGQTLEMAHVRVKPGGKMPLHSHPDGEQVYYILAGTGLLHMGGTSYELSPGKAAFIPKGIEHYTENTGNDLLSYVEARTKEPGAVSPDLPH